ncbi:DUF1648 domain-containing protein [Streptomyces sp. TP-A0874]|uniref:DUF1648 domain-containing protein n=1 Tax=Streptomyces sp. TP-A0874 TaxID=549819 RepID=UPI0008535923|nr:DUF1648 domain-containing protein [Streptomyces sp. TP-A0874]
MDDRFRDVLPWRWLLPSLLLLLGLGVWGASVYPELPEQVPQRITAGGAVDEYATRSVGSVFLPVFVYAGVTAVLIATSIGMAGMRTEEELPPGEGLTGLVNRPADRTAVRRMAKALLLLNFCVGLTIAVTCTATWRPGGLDHVPGWFLAPVLAPSAVGTAVLLVVAVREQSRARPGRSR